MRADIADVDQDDLDYLIRNGDPHSGNGHAGNGASGNGVSRNAGNGASSSTAAS
jgi:hypothetical protein